MHKRIVVAVVGAGVAVAALAGCGNKASQPWKDSPRSGYVNHDPADLIEMPDGFSNLADKCDHGNRVYVLYHGDSTYGSTFVVPQDPTCK